MMVETLLVEQYRCFTSRATLDFHPELNIIVGENGAGKTSVLWALRVLLSHTLRKITKERPAALSFSSDDVAKNWRFLRAEVSTITLGRIPQRVKCTAQKNVSAFIKSIESDGRPREHAVDTPDKYMVEVELLPSQGVPCNTSPPLAVYYSAHRSLALDRGTRKTLAVVGPRAAYAQALDDRGLNLGQAALLWRKESVLEKSDGLPARANRAIEQALPNFLGDFKNIRIEGEDQPRLVVEKRGTTLNLNQLSDGERGLLAVLIDLTRRLALANPELEYPARDGKAVVLIDELDLHMHPRLQRRMASLLKETFPKCQFIATTHSPQIISEIQPESLLLLREEDNRIIPQKCGQAYGLDTNFVLEHIQGTLPRPKPASDAIRNIELALADGNLETGRKLLEKLRTLLHGDDKDVVRLEATINNLEALSNATDPEEA